VEVQIQEVAGEKVGEVKVVAFVEVAVVVHPFVDPVQCVVAGDLVVFPQIAVYVELAGWFLRLFASQVKWDVF